MRRLVLVTLLAACANTPNSNESASVESIIDRTQVVVDKAQRDVRGTGVAAQQFRGAWMRQRAAREAAAQGKAALAAKFSLQARKHAAKALEANGTPYDPVMAQVDPAEKALSRGADDEEHDRWMLRAEKTTPPAGELVQPSEELALRGQVEQLLERSRQALELAREAAKKGGKEQDKYRNAWIRQEVARKCLKEDRLHLAAKFGLHVRKQSFKVLDANGVKAPELAETAAEKALKAPVEDHPDVEFDGLVAEIERTAPSVEELLK